MYWLIWPGTPTRSSMCSKAYSMYPDAVTRDSDIERDAPRPLDVQVADVRATAERFRRVAAVPADWARTVALRNGVTDVAARVPFRRLVEVELHHVDLGIGRELEDLSADFVARETDFLTERFAGHADVPPLALTSPDGRTWRTGRADGTPAAVTGPAADLMGWLMRPPRQVGAQHVGLFAARTASAIG